MNDQSINNIKVVIIPLDGVIFDLNRFRYNYYHHLCDERHIPFSKAEFYSHLSSMYDMYKGLPLEETFDTGPLNAKIERELKQYLDFKGLKPKEGFLELLEYLHQKDIKVAVLSTHRTKDAVHYLQAAKLYNKVHFIIGSDTSSLPLPSSQTLETIQEHFHVLPQETLVISSFELLNQVAYNLHMNIIYCEDLVSASDFEIETSYKVVKNNFEILNCLLFDRYEKAEMYSSILGMDSSMTVDELNHVKDKLTKSYGDDQQLLDVISDTYAYHLSQLHHQSQPLSQPQSQPVVHPRQKTVSPRKRFSFEDVASQPLETIPAKKQEPQIIHEHKEPTPVRSDDHELKKILEQINRKDNVPDQSAPIESTLVEEDDIEDTISFSSGLSQFFYLATMSFLVLFVAIIFYISFIHSFDKQIFPFSILSFLFQLYTTVVESIFRFIFDGLHLIVRITPTYQQYTTSNPLFSSDGVELFNIFIFNIFVGYIFLYIQKQWYKRKDRDRYV